MKEQMQVDLGFGMSLDLPSGDLHGARGFTHESGKYESLEWYTPPWIFEALGLQFDLDPCYPQDKEIPWIPAKRHYTLRDDGLKQPWEGTVWCNPPYGPFIPQWLARMADHNNGVALVFSRTDVGWFHEYAAKAAGVLFLSGRVRFVNGITMKEGDAPGAGSILVAWGGVALAALERAANRGSLALFTERKV